MPIKICNRQQVEAKINSPIKLNQTSMIIVTSVVVCKALSPISL